MFDKWFKVRRNIVDYGDARLAVLLQQWHGIEPRSDFEFRVWRRIRAAAAEESAAPSPWVILCGWLTAEQARVHAMAVTAGLLIGVALALSAPQMSADPDSDAPLLHSRTLADAYLTMVSGGAR